MQVSRATSLQSTPSFPYHLQVRFTRKISHRIEKNILLIAISYIYTETNLVFDWSGGY